MKGSIKKHSSGYFFAKGILGITCFFVLSVPSTNAQFFSKRYSLNKPDGFLSSLAVVNDTVYAMFGVGDTNTNKPIGAFAKFDKNGNLLSTQYFDIPSKIGIGTNINTLIRTLDGGFAYGGWTQDTAETQNSLLILKYDRFGNFQWFNEIMDTNYLSLLPGAFTQDSFSNYYFTGQITHKVTNDNDIYIAKADSLGNPMYLKVFADPNLDDAGEGICVNLKGNIVIGGTGATYNVTNFNGYMKTYELDTGGNVINYVINPDTNGPAAANIIPLSDGGYMISSEYTCIDGVTAICCIEKLDSAFTVVWRTDVGVCSIYNDFFSLKQAPDGNYITTGVTYNDTVLGTNPINGIVVKIAESGQLIWSKEYRGLSNYTNNDDNELNSVGFLSNGEIITGGEALDYNDATHPQQGWLMRLDTAGCLPDSNSCGIVDGIVNIPQSMGSVLVYPNPANDQLKFEVISDWPSDYKLFITDILGRVVSEFDQLKNGTTGIDVREWPEGLYLYRASSGNGYEWSGKFIVEH